MNDVASRAGVSQATVSLILNESPGASFSEETRKRVRQAAEDLGYRRRVSVPQADAARIVLFLVDEFTSDPWMTFAYEGIREKAAELGADVALNVARSTEVAQVAANYDAIKPFGIIYGTILTRKIDPPAPLLTGKTVLLNCYDEHRRIPSVLPGDVVGGREATEYLIGKGCRRIACIMGQAELDAARDRLAGYRQALASHDLAVDPDLIRPGNWEPSSGYDQTCALLALDERPDGIFCSNDLIALGCYEALKEHGVRIPDDIRVVGFDDREIAQYMRPPLSTLQLPQMEMGRLAADLLFDSVGGLGGKSAQLKVECPLVERES